MESNEKLINVSFDELCKEFIEQLEKNNNIVLATCSDNRVTARMMSIINIEENIYFQTSSELIKYKQLLKNKNVALCFSNYQIEGEAKILSHPLKEECKFFLDKYKIIHQGAYELYSKLESNRVIEVKPKLITIWKYIDGKPCRDFIDFEKKVGLREFYNLD